MGINHLKTRLARLYELAEQKKGEPQVIKLSRGLRICMMHYKSVNKIHLAISRQASIPSAEEWRTVLNHWPYTIKFVEPIQAYKDGRTILYAKLPGQITLFDLPDVGEGEIKHFRVPGQMLQEDFLSITPRKDI